MGALEHVHIPGYAALILRRDTQRLHLAGGLIPRSHEWLSNQGATWSGAQKRWTFPTSAEPATLTFGYFSVHRVRRADGVSRGGLSVSVQPAAAEARLERAAADPLGEQSREHRPSVGPVAIHSS
jgi:hypothetical protein